MWKTGIFGGKIPGGNKIALKSPENKLNIFII